MKQVVSNVIDSHLLKPREAAELIPGCSYQSLLRWAREGKVPFIRLPSGRILFRREDILALLAPVEPDVPVGADGGDAALDVPFPALVGM